MSGDSAKGRPTCTLTQGSRFVHLPAIRCLKSSACPTLPSRHFRPVTFGLPPFDNSPWTRTPFAPPFKLSGRGRPGPWGPFFSFLSFEISVDSCRGKHPSAQSLCCVTSCSYRLRPLIRRAREHPPIAWHLAASHWAASQGTFALDSTRFFSSLSFELSECVSTRQHWGEHRLAARTRRQLCVGESQKGAVFCQSHWSALPYLFGIAFAISAGTVCVCTLAMPRKLSNPFSTSTMPPSEKVGERRPSQSKANRLAGFFSSKSKEQQAAQHTIVSPPISSSPGPLPTISLSAINGGELNTDETPTTLFEPPSADEAKRQQRRDAQFGPLLSPTHLYVSAHQGEPLEAPVEDEPPYYVVLTTYISYLLLIAFGHARDFFGKRFGDKKRYQSLKVWNGYAPLSDDFDSFYVRRLKRRLDDCFARPTSGVPGRYITIIDRKSDDFNLSYKFTGTYTETLNLSSYNYLGFAQSEGPCADAVEECVRKSGISYASPRADAGTSDLALEVEREVAQFVGKPAAMVFSMGFVTNAGTFPALVSKGCLIISDELNHASIRIGARLSGAVIRSFKHNSMDDLERKLREAISQGQPRTHRPWKKILVAVEGLYSMEGTMVDLPGVLALKKKYKFFLYVDEAHSIGALGPRGRGVCDYFGIDPAEVDVLMGTLTKAFGANGGYIAGEKHIIDALRTSNAATVLGESPTPFVLMQIQSSLRVITGEIAPGQGEERLRRLAFNSRYLRLGLKRLGFIVYGHDDSPIIPIVLYNPAKMPAFSHEMLRRKISVVVVGYPATPLISSRARFCVSAAHNKDDMDRILAACDEVGDILQLKYSTGIAGGQEPLPEGVTPEMEKEWRRANGLEGVVKPPRWTLEDVIARGAQDTKEKLR